MYVCIYVVMFYEAYVEMIDSFLSERRGRNLVGWLATPLDPLDWRSRPCPWSLSEYSDEIMGMLKVDRRGILQHSVLLEAIKQSDLKVIT